MQHREHSKHNEYTFGWIFIQEIYLITWLNMNNGKQTDVIVMDFAKAFDKVGHRRLIEKMKYYGITPQGFGSNFRSKAHIQRSHPEHSNTRTKTSTSYKSTHRYNMG